MHREDYGTHSLRRTKASIIYKRTGNLRAVQILLGHTKIESTVRYLGVDIEDALALSEGTEVYRLLELLDLKAEEFFVIDRVSRRASRTFGHSVIKCPFRAQPGHADTLVGFPKADKASRRRVGWDGW